MPEAFLTMIVDAALAITEGTDLADPPQPLLGIFEFEIDTQWREQCGFTVLREHPALMLPQPTEVIESLVSLLAVSFDASIPYVRFNETACEGLACHLSGVLTFSLEGQSILIAAHETAHYLLWQERTIAARGQAETHDAQWLAKFIEMLVFIDSIEDDGVQLIEVFDHEVLCPVLEGLELFTLGAFVRDTSCIGR